MLIKRNLYHLYFLRDPISFEIRYVGVSNNPDRRFSEHVKARGETHNARWIRKLKPNKPILQIVDTGDLESIVALEILFISSLNNLTNILLGGEGASYIDEKEKEKRNVRLRQAVRQPNHRIRQSKISKERYKNPEYCLKHKLAVTKSLQTPEYKEKQSEISTKRWTDPVYKKKMLERIQSPENVLAASNQTKEKWKDPEYRAKQKSTRPISGYYNVSVERSDGKIYPNVKTAAQELGVHYTNISKQLAGGQFKIKGFTFKRVKI